MINSIYQNVFGANVHGFNPQRDNYIVVLNFTEKPVVEIIGSYIDKSCYEEIGMSIADAKNAAAIEDRLYQNITVQQNRNNSIIYLVLFEYKDKDVGEELSEALRILKGSVLVKPVDKIAFTAILPEDGSAARTYMKNLENTNLLQNIMGHFIVRERYRDDYLSSSLCGIMMLYGEKSSCEQLERNTAAVANYVDQGCKGLSEEGQQKIKSRPPLFWSTLRVYNHDNKISFLQEYVYGLFSSCISYKDAKCDEVCAAYSKQMFATYSKKQWINRLTHAIHHIPRIIQHEPSTEQSLENYFSQVYGSSYVDVVEMTMQINLQKRYSISRQIVIEAADEIFEHARNYHSRALIEEVIDKLDDYIRNHLKASVAEKLNKSREIMRDDGDVTTDMDRYVDKYIEYCDEVYQRSFWTEVKNYIADNANLFAKQCEAASKLADRLEEEKRKLAVTLSSNSGGDYPSYALTRLFNCAQDEEICNKIKNAYKTYVSATKEEREQREEIEQVQYSPIFPKLTLFYKDFRYNPQSERSSTMVIHQRLGQYYMID